MRSCMVGAGLAPALGTPALARCPTEGISRGRVFIKLP